MYLENAFIPPLYLFDFSFNNLFLCSFVAFVRAVVPLNTKPTDQKINEEKQSLSLHPPV